MNWFTRLWSSPRAPNPAPARHAEAASAAAAPAPRPASDANTDLDKPAEANCPFVPWLSDDVELSIQAISPHEQHTLEVLQGVLA